MRFEASGQPDSPLLIAASTANSGLGEFAGQTVLLGADAFILFNVQTNSDGAFATEFSMPPGVDGAFFIQAAVGLSADFSSAILSNGAQLTIEGLPAKPDSAFFPFDDDDGDGIPNIAEGNGDADGDGVPNFLDPDADGDGEPDSESRLTARVSFTDTDSDGVFDFLDRDDDGDGIPDTEDREPRTALVPADFRSAERLVIRSVKTRVQGGGLVAAARAGEAIELLVGSSGPSTGRFRVLFQGSKSDGAMITATPSSVVDEGSSGGMGAQRLTVTIPPGAASGRLRVLRGELLSESTVLQVVPASLPLLLGVQAEGTSQTLLTAVEQGSTITLVGEGFNPGRSDSIVFVFEGGSRRQQPPLEVNEQGTELRVRLPLGDVRQVLIERNEQESNRLLLNVTRELTGRIEAPEGVGLDPSSLQLERGLISQATPAADGGFAVSAPAQRRSSLEVFDAAGDNLILMALVDATASEVTVNTLTTVTAQIARAPSSSRRT